MAEVGAVMIVGGNINHVTRTMTTTIALETSRGNLELALALGGHPDGHWPIFDQRACDVDPTPPRRQARPCVICPTTSPPQVSHLKAEAAAALWKPARCPMRYTNGRHAIALA